MAKSYAQLAAQIEKLQQQAEGMRQKEASQVIESIRAAVEQYGLTVEDIFGTRRRRGRPPGKKAAATKTRGTRGRKRSASAGKARYRDGNGNEWTGHGRRPQWFLDALAAGKTAEEMAI